MMIEPHPHELELLDYVEDELPRERRRAVGAHVDSCPACRATVAELEGARAALRAAPELELPAEHRRRIDAALGREGPERRARAPRRRLLAVLAAAAVLAAVVAGIVGVTGGRDDSPAGGDAAAPQALEEEAEDEAAGGGQERNDALGEDAESGNEDGSRSSGPLSAAGPVASVRGPAEEVAAALRARGLDARVEGERVLVRGARPRAVVRALEDRPPGPVAVAVE
jgi:hypothetical protein